MSEESITSREHAKIEGGSPDCDNSFRPGYNDIISTKFFDDHICVNDYPPPNIVQFCSTFRPTVRLYHVMILKPAEYYKLKFELNANHSLFDYYKYYFPPPWT